MSDQIIVQNNSIDQIGQILSSLVHKYEDSLDRLRNIDDYDIETRTKLRSECVQEISLDISQDLTIMAKYKLAQDTKYNSYYQKHIDSAIQYLRELRQTLTLYVTAEKL